MDRRPPFDAHAWTFDALSGPMLSDDAVTGCVAYIKRIDGYGDEVFLMLLPRGPGDLGDLYKRITGESRPDLRGPLSLTYTDTLANPR